MNHHTASVHSIVTGNRGVKSGPSAAAFLLVMTSLALRGWRCYSQGDQVASLGAS